MKFECSTEYNQKALTAMAGALRKTVRKKHSRRSHIFGWIVVALGLFLVLPFGEKTMSLDFRTILTMLVVLTIVLTICFEDRLNGYFVRKQMLKGMEKSFSIFEEDSFSSATELGKTIWNYDKIALVVETNQYFVFVFSKNHGQVYDKSTLGGGTVAEFREFLRWKTGKEIIKIH